MQRPAEEQFPTPETRSGCLPVIARLTWMMFGNLALAMLAVFILETDSRFSAFDVAFWTVAVGLVVVRYLDITRLGGLTGDGEPASLQHWRRYAGVLVAACACLWVLAHAARPLIR